MLLRRDITGSCAARVHRTLRASNVVASAQCHAPSGVRVAQDKSPGPVLSLGNRACHVQGHTLCGCSYHTAPIVLVLSLVI